MLRLNKTIGLLLMILLATSLALPTIAEDGEIALRWAFGALESDTDEPSAIKRDTQLESGDRLKFLVEPLSEGSIYLILLDAAKDIHVLYRESIEAARGPGPSYIPPGQQWFELDDNRGLETFFLLASVEPLTGLETLLDKYAAADVQSKKGVGVEVVAEIRSQHRAHRQFARPIEKPMMIGGQTRSASAGASIDKLAVEVKAERFYAKTITIEH